MTQLKTENRIVKWGKKAKFKDKYVNIAEKKYKIE